MNPLNQEESPIKPTESEPQIDTNALLRELIEEVQALGYKLDSIESTLSNGITVYDPR